MNHPEIVDRLAILNAAHPRKLSEGLHHPGQLRKSWYFFFFALPGLPDSIVHANNWHFFRHFLHDANPRTRRGDRALHRGVVTAGCRHRDDQLLPLLGANPAKKAAAAIQPVKAPTLVIWGQRDATSGKSWPSPSTTTSRTSTVSSGCRTPRTGSITTRRSESTSCSPTSSRPPAQPRHVSQEEPQSVHEESRAAGSIRASRSFDEGARRPAHGASPPRGGPSARPSTTTRRACRWR